MNAKHQYQLDLKEHGHEFDQNIYCFSGVDFINSPMQLLWQTGTETRFRHKHKSSPLTSVTETLIVSAGV